MGSSAKQDSIETITKPSHVCCGIFSILSFGEHGGLENYVHTLTAGLKEAGAAVQWNGDKPSNGSTVTHIWKPRIKRLLPLMTRNPTRRIARQMAEFTENGWCKQSLQSCDVVHFVGTGWDLLGFPLLRAAQQRGIPMTCWPAVHPGKWGDSPLDTDLYNQMDAVFIQSEFEGKHLTSLGVHTKFITCGCAPRSDSTGDEKKFRAEYGLENAEVVLFVGRKSREKGYHELRNAIATLYRRGRPIVLVTIGREVDPPYPRLNDAIDIDLGVVDDSVKQDALASCDVFALPSSEESFGIVYIEAWSYGKAVICGTAPASRELILKHNGGLLSDGTASDIAEKISSLLDDVDQRAVFGESGKMAVATNYNQASITRTHLDAWAQI